MKGNKVTDEDTGGVPQAPGAAASVNLGVPANDRTERPAGFRYVRRDAAEVWDERGRDPGLIDLETGVTRGCRQRSIGAQVRNPGTAPYAG